MSQTNDLPTSDEPSFDDAIADHAGSLVNEQGEELPSPSSDALSNSNDDWKSIDSNNDMDKIPDDPENKTKEAIDYDDDWASFGSFPQPGHECSETKPVTGDGWADFESNTQVPGDHSAVSSHQEQITTDDDDGFGDYSEGQISTKSPVTSHNQTSSLNTDQIESLLSSCFPLESSTCSTDHHIDISPELPSFTTFQGPIQAISGFAPSLSLWKVLSNISNDPLGIQYKWRKSATERLFHKALGVSERFHLKATSAILDLSPADNGPVVIADSDDDDERTLPFNSSPHFDWKESGLKNPLTDIDNSPPCLIPTSQDEDHVAHVDKTLDLDYFVPPICSPPSVREERVSPSPSTTTPPQRSATIKTMDLFPGSTTFLTDDPKPPVDLVANFSFMNAKALMSPLQFHGNSTGQPTTLF